MKRILTIIIVTLLILTLTACTQKEESTPIKRAVQGESSEQVTPQRAVATTKSTTTSTETRAVQTQVDDTEIVKTQAQDALPDLEVTQQDLDNLESELNALQTEDLAGLEQ